MSQPQQREVARSERGEIDPQARKVAREGKQVDDEKGRRGKVPPENRAITRRRNRTSPDPEEDSVVRLRNPG